MSPRSRLALWLAAALAGSTPARAAEAPPSAAQPPTVATAPPSAAPPSPAPPSALPLTAPVRRALGFTVDLLPIVLSASVGKLGLSGQIWFGVDHVRFRLVGALLALPNWVAAKDGFEDQTMTSVAAIVDYVWGEHFDGWWVGAGLEYWHSSIAHEDVPGRRVAWDTGVATVGGGYIWSLLGDADVRFYIEPWAAAHVRITPAHPTLEGHRYTPPWVNGEVSLKLGVFFEL